ncbi:MAG TPA: hydroxyethylthiazole kinase [Firmicutes bacterium]|nr:hydroxyethylthiazole kinase [Bacillota bacterium]
MQTGKMLAAVRAQKPLVYHITNTVTISDCANITLVCGGLPVMAPAAEEAEEMAAQAQAVVLNIGTLTKEQVRAMLLAGRKARELHIPVILDPVGAGATALRLESARRLVAEVAPDIIKGNAAEIAVLAGGKAVMRGVESVAVTGSVTDMALSLAREAGSVVAVTGAVDVVTDGGEVVEVYNGHPLMACVVGTGCMTASLMGCFAAVERNRLQAAAAALSVFNLAAEEAARQAQAPAAFKAALFDALYGLDPAVAEERQKITRKVSGK